MTDKKQKPDKVPWEREPNPYDPIKKTWEIGPTLGASGTIWDDIVATFVLCEVND